MNAPAYYTSREIEARFRISRATRARWVREGYLPRPVKVGPGAPRWIVVEIEALEQRAVQDRGA